MKVEIHKGCGGVVNLTGEAWRCSKCRKGPIPVDRVELADATCKFCSAPCSKNDFCHGCKQHICDACDVQSPGGWHAPEAHRVDPDQDGDESW